MAHAAADDQELLRQLAKGNQAAFNLCYERYQGPIYRFAWHMSGNQTSAEEVTQEVFVRLIHNPRKFDSAKGSLAGYLFGIARNVMRRQMAASFLDVPLEDEELKDAALAADQTCFRSSIAASGSSCCINRYWRCRPCTARRWFCVIWKR